jgi:hypothetical protein
MISALIFLTSIPQKTSTLSLDLIGEVKFDAVDEMSGIVKSRRFKNTYWVHNDSGDSARFFAIRRNGDPIQPATKMAYSGILVPDATNIDWEDITIDGDTLYLCDVGNNLNMRRDLTIYSVKEPNPEKERNAPLLARIPISFPDQTEFPPSKLWNFDCEAVAAHRGKLYFVTKWRASAREPGNGASIYVLDKPRKDGESNIVKKLDTNANLGGWVTGADISPDGKRIALLVQAPKAGVWIFDMTKGPRILSHPLGYVSFAKARQCEAICWDSPTRLIVTNEQREIFEVDAPSNYPQGKKSSK